MSISNCSDLIASQCKKVWRKLIDWATAPKKQHPVEPITYGAIFTYHKQILGTGCHIYGILTLWNKIKKKKKIKISARKSDCLFNFDFIFGTIIVNKVTSCLSISFPGTPCLSLDWTRKGFQSKYPQTQKLKHCVYYSRKMWAFT